MTIKLHNWIQYAISPSTHLRQSEQQPLHQGDFRARATVPPLGNSLFQQHNAKPRDGYHYIFDLHFHRHVIYGTCLGCGAPGIKLQHFVDSHTKYMEGDSPRTYPGRF